MLKITPMDLAIEIREFHQINEAHYDHASQKSGGWGSPGNPLEYTPGRTRTYDHKGQANDSDND